MDTESPKAASNAEDGAPQDGPAPQPAPAGGAAAKGSTDSSLLASKQPKVVLRQEVATKLQARILTWSVIILNVLFVVLSVVLFGLHSKSSLTAREVRNLYWGRLGIAVACQAALVFSAVWFVLASRQAYMEGRVWDKRQQYFGWTAGGLLILQTTYASLVLSSISATLAQPDCRYPWKALAILQFFQWGTFSGALFFLLARMKNMVLWRGPGALDMHPDYRLVVDRPYKDQVKSHALALAIWLVLLGVALAGAINKYIKIDNAGPRLSAFNCDTDIKNVTCGASPTQVVTTIVWFAVILLMALGWVLVSRRAVRDHEQLPFNHYRPTHMYVRVQARLLTAVFTAVVFSVFFQQLLPSLQGSCVAFADALVGNVAVDLSMTVAASVMAILYMPKAQALDSPLLQEFLQDFAWTQDGIAAAVAARNQRLKDSEAAGNGDKSRHGVTAESVVTDVLTFLPGAAMLGVAKLAGVKDMRSALEQLRQEPIFCLELAIRLFYWARLAYRTEPNLDDAHCNAEAAKKLFDLQEHCTIWDDTTDTHCVIGWSAEGGRVVLAFRGTASLQRCRFATHMTQNAMIDLSAWKVTLLPKRRVHGTLVKAHAGFANAWLTDGFNTKVLDKLREIDAARPPGSPPLHIWLTGHSLGGALAILASVEVRRQCPDAQIACYTWGAPRVGNSAFFVEQEEAVPDTWAILNGLDPIPFIPKGSFKRAGKRVTINPAGDLILRPSYFEVSVMQRGTSTKHHMTVNYALSIAMIVKAQFSAAKAFPGGAEGVRQLAASLDLGQTLTMRNLDIASLEQPDVLPCVADAKGSRRGMDSKGALQECGDSWCGGSGGGCLSCCGWSGSSGEAEEGMEGVAAAKGGGASPGGSVDTV